MMSAPIAVVWLCSEILFFQLPTPALLFVSLASGLVFSAVASRVWERRSRTAEISFSELMIWSWYRLQKAERRLERSLREAESADTHQERLLALYELNEALEAKDPYTRGHSRRVERYSFLTGLAMGLPLEDIEVLRMSASVHDVGKVGIPNTILHKPGRLTDEERALVETHPVVGSEMVTSIGDDRIVGTVRHHHERWDGGGYPDGVAGTQIPLFSRVIAVADSYDAIRSNRSYRAGGSRDKAVDIIRTESGHQFDPDVVEAFMTTLPARSRVAAAFASLTGPGALWRYVWQLLQRFGSTGLAPALGAIGAGVIFVASPLLPSSEAPLVAVAAVLDSEVAGSAAVGSEGAPNAAGEKVEQRRIERRRAAERVAERVAARDRRRTRRQAGSKGSREGSTSTASTQDAGSATSTTQNVPSTTENTATANEPAPSTVTSGDHESVDDPNARGKDCKPGLGNRSKGSNLHCG